MKLSIITVNYNNFSGLETTIASVASQTIKNFEFIVIDGASTDGSLEIIKRNSDIITYWLSEPDAGIYDAMNKGILIAKGDYLQFMNSGDVFYGNDITKLETQYIEQNPDVDIFYGDIALIKGGDELIKVRQPTHINAAFFRINTLNHQAAMINRALFNDNLYDTTYKLAGDYVKFAEWAIHGKVFKHISHILVGYDFTGLSTTEKGIKQYSAECTDYWKTTVPRGLDNIIADYNIIKEDTEHIFVKRSIRIHKLIQLFDQKVKQTKQAIKSGVKSLIRK